MKIVVHDCTHELIYLLIHLVLEMCDLRFMILYSICISDEKLSNPIMSLVYHWTPKIYPGL